MSEVSFNCPHCNQPLEAPSEMTGETTECPSCKTSILVLGNQSDHAEKLPSRPDSQHCAPPNPPPASAVKHCPYCGEVILRSAVKCKHCGEFLDGRKPVSHSSPTQDNQMPGIPTCQHCGSKMKKTVVSSGNCSGLVLALIAFCVGVVITVSIPVIGWVVGPLICIGALFMGGKRSKVWKCTKCGSVVNRA